jgi:predicted AlkP superfamily pyrophosphatase or phosphodiesterase
LLQACASEGNRHPTALIAVDGLEWDVVLRLLGEGKLPNIAALMQGGSFGEIESFKPTLSPIIWTTVATGQAPNKHGVEGFIHKDELGEDQQLYTARDRKTKAFWNILSDYGLGVHCFGWWITYPVESINGVMVSQTNTTAVLRNPRNALWKGTLLAGVEGQVHPPEYQNHIMSMLADVDASLDEITREIFGELPFAKTEFSQQMWDQTRWAFRADAVYLRAARETVASAKPFDMLAVYIGGPDVSGHRFWRYAYPAEFRYPPSSEQLANFGHLIDDYYVHVDESLGEIIAATPAGTTVMIVSDHGMHAVNQRQSFLPSDPPARANSGNHLDAPPGVFIAAGPSIRDARLGDAGSEALTLDALPTVGGVLDVLPTLLVLKSLPIGRDLDGRPMASVIDGAWLEQHPISIVDTHDDSSWQAARRQRVKEAVDQNERLEQLRSLGYIE